MQNIDSWIFLLTKVESAYNINVYPHFSKSINKGYDRGAYSISTVPSDRHCGGGKGCLPRCGRACLSPPFPGWRRISVVLSHFLWSAVMTIIIHIITICVL